MAAGYAAERYIGGAPLMAVEALLFFGESQAPEIAYQYAYNARNYSIMASSLRKQGLEAEAKKWENRAIEEERMARQIAAGVAERNSK